MALKRPFRDRVNSNSFNSTSTTAQSERAPSIFSDYDNPDTSTMTSPATSLLADDDCFVISKQDFEASTKKRKRYATVSGPIVRNGSTLGGIDPLHALLQESGIEPQHWREERKRKEYDARYETSHKKRATRTPPSRYLQPARYEKLPYSPQDYFTSGLDINREPETREGFWRRVKKGWEESCKRESVEARRKRFGKGSW